MKYISINKCQKHGYFSIFLDDESGSGTRLTSSKCCGSWQEVKRWPLTSEELKEIANEFECAADDQD